jgi:hypothetical protein
MKCFIKRPNTKGMRKLPKDLLKMKENFIGVKICEYKQVLWEVVNNSQQRAQ